MIKPILNEQQKKQTNEYIQATKTLQTKYYMNNINKEQGNYQ